MQSFRPLVHGSVCKYVSQKKTNNSLFFFFYKLPFGPKAGTLSSAFSKAQKGNCSELGCVVNLKIFLYNANNGCVIPHF